MPANPEAARAPCNRGLVGRDLKFSFPIKGFAKAYAALTGTNSHEK